MTGVGAGVGPGLRWTSSETLEPLEAERVRGETGGEGVEELEAVVPEWPRLLAGKMVNGWNSAELLVPDF